MLSGLGFQTACDPDCPAWAQWLAYLHLHPENGGTMVTIVASHCYNNAKVRIKITSWWSPHHCSLQFSASSDVEISNQNQSWCCMKKSNHWDPLDMDVLVVMSCARKISKDVSMITYFCFLFFWGGSFHPKKITSFINGKIKTYDFQTWESQISWGSQHVRFQTSLGMWIAGRELLELWITSNPKGISGKFYVKCYYFTLNVMFLWLFVHVMTSLWLPNLFYPSCHRWIIRVFYGLLTFEATSRCVCSTAWCPGPQLAPVIWP